MLEILRKWLPSIASIGALIGVAVVYLQLGDLDARLVDVETRPEPTYQVPAEKRTKVVHRREASAEVMHHGQVENQVAGSTEAVVDEHLWSEGGRAAIDDVVEEREEIERERRSERWQKMMQYRVDQTVDAVVEQRKLSPRQTEQVEEVLATFTETRSTLWRAMHNDEIEPAEFHEQRDALDVQLEADLTELIGADGYAVVLQEMENNRGWH